jgi:hypothetical protein
VRKVSHFDIVYSTIDGVQASLIWDKIRERHLELRNLRSVDISTISERVKKKSLLIEIIPCEFRGEKGFIWRYPNRPDIMFLPPNRVLIIHGGAPKYDRVLCEHHVSIALNILKSIDIADVDRKDVYYKLRPNNKSMPKETKYI